jgi:hypothetical protein
MRDANPVLMGAPAEFTSGYLKWLLMTGEPLLIFHKLTIPLCGDPFSSVIENFMQKFCFYGPQKIALR